ncbi:1137_t:CDS:2 [Acaulospora morrowiae]|uniref:1137_t:CDS:1 n=1 Tax=Acaulospora morrowiae TaxID=94023 RepID=A0A9N9A9U6_9GLOM|nr:1137_t:CDS:2 [Acaulospora morrowiae]
MSDHLVNKHSSSQRNQKNLPTPSPFLSTDTTYQRLQNILDSLSSGIDSLVTGFCSVCLQFIDDFQKTQHKHEEPFILTEEDLFDSGSSNPLFLGDYSYDDIDENLQKYQIKRGLSERGYNNIVIDMDTTDYWVHKLCISDKSLSLGDNKKNPNVIVDSRDYTNSENENILLSLPQNDQFLIDLFIRKKEFSFSDFKSYQLMRRIETYYENKINGGNNETSYSNNQIKRIHYIDGEGATQVYMFFEKELTGTYLLSSIEWICMQDPRRNFSKDHPQFPGQNYPGLRVGRRVGNMLIELEASKGRDGLSNAPEYFHNAFMYHTQNFRFLNPAYQAYFDCLCDSLSEDLKIHGLSAVSWAFQNGHVKNTNGDIEVWNPEDQIYPTSSKLQLYFSSSGYQCIYKAFRKRGYHVSIDWSDAKEIWKYSLKDFSTSNAKYSLTSSL